MRHQLERRFHAIAAADIGGLTAMTNNNMAASGSSRTILAVAILGAACAAAQAQTKPVAAKPAPADSADAVTVQRIEARGGYVVRDRDGSISEVSLARTWATDEDLNYVSGIKTLKQLDLSFTLVTDKGIKELEQLRPLEDLN